MINTNKFRIWFSIMCLLMMFAPMIGAAASNNESFGIGDFIKPSGAKQELEDSAFKTPVDKGSTWGTLALVVSILIYFGGCLYKFCYGDDDDRAKAFKGIFFGIVMVVVFLAGTSTALDSLTWDY